MINMTQFVTGEKKDNEVMLNGAKFMVTDEVAMQILNLVSGNIVSAPQTAYKAVQSPVTVTTTTAATAEKKSYVATKDFKAQYEVKELTATDGTKLFCISRKNGWTRAEKGLMNQAIKALKGIKEIEVAGIRKDKDGNEKSITFKAWGYGTEATAKKHVKELPDTFTADQLNSWGVK